MDATPRRRRDARSDTDRTTRVTDRQRQLFDLLDPHFHFKYLTSKWAHEFVGGNEQAFKFTLRNLFDAGYLDRPKQQKYSPNSNYKHLVYERTEKTARAVSGGAPSERMLVHRSNSYAHELIVDLGFSAPLWYAAAHDPALKLYTAKDLIAGSAFDINSANGIQRIMVPKVTRENPDPFLIHLKNNDAMRFDGTPFVLERKMAHGSASLIFVPGIEVDRDTEGFSSRNPKDPLRSTLSKHLLQIMDFFAERGFQRHFGFPMMMVPIITTNATRMQSAMAFVEKEIGACRYLLFKTLPDLALESHFPAPSGEFFTSPWLRVRQPPFQFDERGFG